MDDLISRQAVLDILNRSEWKTPEELEVFEFVKKLPSVNSMQSSDVISRQMALDTVDNLRTIITNNMPALIYKSSVLKWLHELPSAQPEHKVIRCKDCKHRDPENKKCDCGCWHIPFTTKDDDFCSYAESEDTE